MTAPAIPEFILRKLIVPNSFRTSDESISFSILNSFTPGTLIGLEIEINDSKISSSNIILSAKDRNPVTASDISPSNPYSLSMGLTVTVKILHMLSAKKIKFSALTKEIGELRFTFNPSLQKVQLNNHQKFKVRKFFLSPLKADVAFSLDSEIGRISPYIYGQFIEHLEDCIYGGIWTKDGSSLRPDTLELIKSLHPPIIRYPGGNFASGYHWEDGIGPVLKRPERFDAAWQASEKNQVGTDEYIRFCREIATEPFLVVNDGSGTAEEAANWVEYCNGSETTGQGRQRKANGETNPHNVKMWGIGNEVWGAWQIGTTNAEAYTDRLLNFIYKMKNVDPSIKIVAVGDGMLTDDKNDKGLRWNSEIIRKAGKDIDYLSWHIYQPDQSAWLDHYDLEKLHWSICSAPLDVEKIIQRTAKLIGQLSPEKQILQALDEWNLWLTPPPDAESMHKLRYTMRDALYCAGMLNVFIRNSNSLGMANLAQLVNVLPLIVATNEKAFPTSMFFPFLMYKKMLPVALSTKVQSSTYNSEPLGSNITAHDNVPFLDITATKDEVGQKISIALINRHHSRQMNVNLKINEVEYFHPTDASVLCSNNPLDFNTAKEPCKVSMQATDLPISLKGEFKGKLPPCSVTLWEFNRK